MYEKSRPDPGTVRASHPSRRITAGKVNHHPFALASFFSKLLKRIFANFAFVARTGHRAGLFVARVTAQRAPPRCSIPHHTIPKEKNPCSSRKAKAEIRVA